MCSNPETTSLNFCHLLQECAPVLPLHANWLVICVTCTTGKPGCEIKGLEGAQLSWEGAPHLAHTGTVGRKANRTLRHQKACVRIRSN